MSRSRYADDPGRVLRAALTVNALATAATGALLLVGASALHGPFGLSGPMPLAVVGGLFGYLIGYAFLETFGQWIIQLYGLADRVAEYQAAYNRWGLWIILIKGLTPIPYKLVTIASGMAHFSLPVFVLASILTRGLRFFMVAGLLRWYGAQIRDFIEARLTLVTTGFAALIVLGFLSIRYL